MFDEKIDLKSVAVCIVSYNYIILLAILYYRFHNRNNSQIQFLDKHTSNVNK